jgi:hypothetical protein
MNSKRGIRGLSKRHFSFYEFKTQEFERDLKELGEVSKEDWRGFTRDLTEILLWTCALQLKTLNQLKSKAHSYKQFYMYATIYLWVDLGFDLAVTCSTYCRKNFKKLRFFISQKPRLLQNI